MIRPRLSVARAGPAVAVAAAVALVAALLTGCGSSGTAAPDAPVLHVATGLYPLAAAVAEIGGPSATVVDVVPGGQDPNRYQLPSAAVATVHTAGLVVEEGGGLQPSFESAAAGAADVLALHADPATAEAFPWLDPTAMTGVVSAIAAAMARADPHAAGAFRANARDFSAELSSTGIDYQSTLSACPRHTIVTANGAFSAVARRYGLTDQILGPADPGRGAVATVRAAGVTEVYAEPWVDDAPVRAVAAAAHLKVKSLDTLLGPPAGGWPAKATYIQLLESNLGVLSGGLGCPDLGSGAS